MLAQTINARPALSAGRILKTISRKPKIANLREAFGGTAIASLEWQVYEAAIDRVAASGKCSKLGVALWKARYQREQSAARIALGLLRIVVGNRYTAEAGDIISRISSQAIIEYIDNKCTTCGGRQKMVLKATGRGSRDIVVEQGNYREIDKDDKVFICQACHGSGIRKWTDEARAVNMLLSWAKTKALAHKIAWIADLIQEQDRDVNYHLNVELERYESA